MKEEKSKNWFARHKILTVVLALIAIGVIASASGGDKGAEVVNKSSNDQSEQVGSEAAEEKTQFNVGEDISFDSKTVTISNVERNWNSGNQFITPDSGNEYVKVQVDIQNNSNNQVSYNTFDWKIQNSNGVIKDVDSAAFVADGALNSGELAANGKVSGFLVFQVPAGDEGLVLQYSPSFWTSKKLEIKI